MGRVVGAGLTLLGPTYALGPSRADAQTAAGLSGPPSTWRFEMGGTVTWYENARYLPGGSDSSWSIRGRAALSRTQRFRSGAFTIAGHGGRLYYPDVDELGQWTYGGAATLGWTPSRKTSLSISQRYARTNTRQIDAIDEEGLPVPTTGIDILGTGLTLTQGLSQATQLELSGSYAWRRYDDPALIGGEQLHSSIGLARSVSRSGSMALSYGFSQSHSLDLTRRVHVASLGIRHRPQRGLAAELSGGVAYLESVGQFYPTGGAGVSASGRHVSFSLRYRRDFGLAFGYGRETIADRVSAGLGWTPAERISLSVGYTYAYRRDPADDGFRVKSHVGSAGLSWKVTNGVGINALYRRELNDTEGFNRIDGGQVSLHLSYGFDWR